MKKRLTAMIMCIALLLALPYDVQGGFWQEEKDDMSVVAASVGESLDLTCKAAILVEPQTGRVIYEKNADERMPEASITKVMTMLLVFEAIDSGRISLDDTAVASAHAVSMGGSQIWLEEGEQMTVRELIKATMVGSANDAAVVLAELVAGTHESFVAMMNDRAAQLGMDNTAYKNCTGLDAEGHVSSARDIAIVSNELMKHEEVFEYSTIWMDSLRGGETQLTNTNKLIRTYDGATGLKTGTTSQAGCCIAATAERDGMGLIAVVMGAPNGKSRVADARKLLDYGFANYSLLDLSAVSVDIPTVKVLKGIEKEVPACVDMSGSVLIPKGREGDVIVSVSIAESIEAPVEHGQIVGTVTLTLDESTIGSYDILTDGATDAVTFSNVFGMMLDALFNTQMDALYE